MVSQHRTGVVAALLLVAVVALAACDSGGSRAAPRSDGSGSSSTTLPGTSTDFDAGAAARKVRRLENVHVSGTSKLWDSKGRVDVRISYGDPFRMVGRIAVPVTSQLADVELRRTGDLAWVRRAIPKASTQLTMGLPIIVFRGPNTAPFLRLFGPDYGVQTYLTANYDPARLLDSLNGAEGVTWRRVGDHEHAVVDVSAARTKGVTGLDVWTDARGVPERMRFDTALGGTVDYSIARADRAVKVDEPPAAQVQPIDQPLPDATEGYVTVARVDAGGTPVEIQRAPARDGWTCWKAISTPAFVGVDTARPSGAYCSGPTFDTRSDDEKFAIALDAAATTPYELLVLQFPPGTTGQVTSLLGTSPLSVDGLGTAIVAGPAANPALLVTVRTPAGTDLVCGPGGVVNELSARTVQPDGADTEDPAFGGPLRANPWNCMPKDLADQLGAVSR